MPKLEWDKTSERLYETGVDKGVLYLQSAEGTYPKGVAWNGLISVTEKPTGAEPTPMHANNKKYLNLMSEEEFEATIEAYTYPEEFAACNGEASIAPGVTIGQQTRKQFGMAYQSIVGNDTEMNAHGYKIHLVYGALAAPSEKAYNTVNDTPEAMTLSWEVSTTKVDTNIDGFKPTASVTIDSTKTDPEKLAALEKIIYGDGDTEARLPLPSEVATIIGTEAAAG